MPFDTFIQKALLDWNTGAASVTRPTGRFVGLESGSARFSSDSPAQCFRTTALFAGAVSVAGSPFAQVTNSAAATLSCSAVCTVFGFAIYNSTSGGQRLMYGSLTATQTLRIGSHGVFAANTLRIFLQ